MDFQQAERIRTKSATAVRTFYGVEMPNRDDFSTKTKRAVALRASYRCSLCKTPTAGPSDDSSTAVALIGVAAHICAAAPGGKRYLPSMPAEERSHIDNAIWLCANHATLIDRDSKTYTPQKLRAMKRDHEADSAIDLSATSMPSAPAADLLAIGPDVVCVGDIIGIDGPEWKLHLNHFVIGDVGTLIAFAESFGCPALGERYLLVNAIGDGRTLAAAPSLTKSENGYVAKCQVHPSFPRIKAEDLARDFALSPRNDLVMESGSIAMVSGLGALPQKIRTSLSHQKGESPFHPDFGTRLAEYYELFRTSPWLGRLIKLEVIRQAAIPYSDVIMRRDYTPLQCVERVWGIAILAEAPQSKWLPVRVDLDVKGVGRWQCDISVFLPQSIE